MEKIKESFRPRDGGYSSSFYIHRTDVDFFAGLKRYLELNNMSIGEFISITTKSYIIQSNDMKRQFTSIYQEVVQDKIDNTIIVYRGKKRKLSTLLEEDFILDSIIKI